MRVCMPHLQAAQLDPNNPRVFLLLGHYQRVITKDLKSVEFHHVELYGSRQWLALLLSVFISICVAMTTKMQRRAVKCYQKSFSIQPDLSEAGLCLGEVLFMTGDEV